MNRERRSKASNVLTISVDGTVNGTVNGGEAASAFSVREREAVLTPADVGSGVVTVVISVFCFQLVIL